MDAFLYPELFYGSSTASNSLFKVNSSHFENNKRFVNLNHKIKLNPTEAQKLNSELLKFNYGSKRELTQMLSTNNRKATAVDSSSEAKTVALPKVAAKSDDLKEPSKTSLTKAPSKTSEAVPAILTEMSRQSLEINPVMSVDQANAGSSSKRYFYRYLLNKKYNSTNNPQQIFANVLLPPPAPPAHIASNNKSLSISHGNMNDLQSSSSFSMRSNTNQVWIMPIMNCNEPDKAQFRVRASFQWHINKNGSNLYVIGILIKYMQTKK